LSIISRAGATSIGVARLMSQSSGASDWATWIGAGGTWAVGILAAVIAWMQYRNGVFRPKATTYVEAPTWRRIAVRITNRGGAAGMVERVELVTVDHEAAPLVDYEWEGWNPSEPVPFVLPGKASAILVLSLKKALAKDVRVRIRYGDGGSSGCLDLQTVPGTLKEKTTLPPDSLAIKKPP
jgi:hypothetical protein